MISVKVRHRGDVEHKTKIPGCGEGRIVIQGAVLCLVGSISRSPVREAKLHRFLYLYFKVTITRCARPGSSIGFSLNPDRAYSFGSIPRRRRTSNHCHHSHNYQCLKLLLCRRPSPFQGGFHPPDPPLRHLGFALTNSIDSRVDVIFMLPPP